ncbi:phosphoethanolamine transferase [Rodentibacter caecimuris]|uniref:phosphoethanolamine transferase n=1 Tax=Rodentibacter caecimuris TaxID=1796644 RepID=UPI001094A699|nr:MULTISPECIES: phosphoethanolamine--lipid A transferase [Pasteurellaceae]MCR1837529.1 phosphoethanolamine--lipid A transferase [Pasteurella caecimuris]MCU0107146.1 phosphoethanolamine--lipid A transferase [Pasteurella caecimuris]QIA77883.1 phosphoethanolamine--lipid A transferase [Rodentibacter heylii]TGY50696.1 phosphoethanolamine--lipid A transferase [Pasteurella caecimuris]
MRFSQYIFRKFSLSSTAIIALVSLYFTLVLNYQFYQTVLKLNPFTGSSEDYFLFTVPFFVFFTLNAAFQLISLPILHKVVIPLLLVISAAISYQEIFFGIYFDSNQLNNVLQTNFAESSRMVTTSYLLWIFALGVIPAWLYIRTQVNYRRWYKEILIRLGMIVLSCVVVIIIGKFYYKDYAAFSRNNKEIVHLIVPSNFIGSTIQLVKKNYRTNLPFTEIGLDTSVEKPDEYRHVTILVVGETTRAPNWGLNGYARQTTPKLAVRDDIINFKNVSSCGTATAISVPCMFSRYTRSDYNATKAEHEDNLLDILQRAGVDVLWRDNDMGCKGVCERVPTQNLTALNLAEYCRNGECLDEILLKDLDKELNKSNNDIVIVLHTIGSHGPTYNERYSKAFETFTPTCETNEIQKCSNEQLVNTYDNGILYIDNFLNEVIKLLEQKTNWESIMFYVSDHGESLGEDGIYLHAAPYAIAPDYQTRVPMVMWFSPTWVKNEGFDLNCLRKNAETQEYSHDNYFHTIFSMLDIKNDLNIYDKKLDILAQCKIRN